MGFLLVGVQKKRPPLRTVTRLILVRPYAAFCSFSLCRNRSALKVSSSSLHRPSTVNGITTIVVFLFFNSMGKRLGFTFCTYKVTASSSPMSTSLGSIYSAKITLLSRKLAFLAKSYFPRLEPSSPGIFYAWTAFGNMCIMISLYTYSFIRIYNGQCYRITLNPIHRNKERSRCS